MIKVCHNCQSTFETDIPKKVACSRKCSQTWRQKNVYKDRYTVIHRSLNPRNFLQCLANKKVSRRSLDVHFLVQLYEDQQGKCAISGRDMTYIAGEGRVPTNISIDRIDSSLGYEAGNIQLVCIQANKMKAELSMFDLQTWCSDILEYDKRKRK